MNFTVDSGNVQTPPATEQPLRWRSYLGSIGMVVLVTLVGLPVHFFLNPTNVIMLYLLGIVLIAWRWGQGPSTVGALLSVLAFDVFFVPPYLTLAVADAEYLITFVGLLVVGLTVSALTAQARSQASAARHRETQVTASYELSRKLAAVHQTDEILQAVIGQTSQTFEAEIAVFLPGAAGLALRLASDQYHVEPDEGAAAAQVFQRRPLIQTAPADYICLQTARHTLGVLGVKRRGPGTWLPEQRRLLESFASQTALALERAQLVEQTYQMELWQARERLYTALLNSISHDLRTPLASITGVLSTLRENQTSLSAEGQVDLLETAWEEAKRLNRLVGNLLDMSRLEAGALTIRREAYEVQDLLGVTLAELGERLRDRPLTLDIPADLPMVAMDLLLMVQVLANLLDNAVKYSPPGAPLTITARAWERNLELAVADRGMGIPEADLTQVFEKFYRVPRPDDAGGTGLGLSVSKGIVEAHGGRIWAECRPGGGTVITVALPLDNQAVPSEPQVEKG